jgi:hypothetical protein
MTVSASSLGISPGNALLHVTGLSVYWFGEDTRVPLTRLIFGNSEQATRPRRSMSPEAERRKTGGGKQGGRLLPPSFAYRARRRDVPFGAARGFSGDCLRRPHDEGPTAFANRKQGAPRPG